MAILPTTPALLGLFSLITLWADGLARDTANTLRPNAAAWYRKKEPTFSDAIAAVRRMLWAPSNSPCPGNQPRTSQLLSVC